MKTLSKLLMLLVTLVGTVTMWAAKPNVTVRMTKAERVGFHVWVTYMITNNEGQDVKFDLLNPTATYAYSSDGKKYSVMLMRGERRYSEFANMSFPAGIPVKVQVIVGNVPTSETTLARVSLGLATPWETFPTINQNVPIEVPAPNSDNENTVLNYPWATIKTLPCERLKIGTTQMFTITSPKEIKIQITKVTAYDEEGNSYPCVFGTDISSFTVPENIPQRCGIVVKNVPTTLKKLLAIKADLRIDDFRYLLQFNNVEIK